MFIREDYVFVCNLTQILKKSYVQIYNTSYCQSTLWYFRNRWKCLEGSLLSTLLSFVISKHRMIWQYYFMSYYIHNYIYLIKTLFLVEIWKSRMNGMNIFVEVKWLMKSCLVDQLYHIHIRFYFIPSFIDGAFIIWLHLI